MVVHGCHSAWVSQCVVVTVRGCHSTGCHSTWLSQRRVSQQVGCHSTGCHSTWVSQHASVTAHRLSQRGMSQHASVTALGLSSSAAGGNLPRPGINLASPALAGGCSTTGPPGKPHSLPFSFTLGFLTSVSISVPPRPEVGPLQHPPCHPAPRWHVPHPKHHPQEATHDGGWGSPHPHWAHQSQDLPWCSPTLGKCFPVFLWRGRYCFLIV